MVYLVPRFSQFGVFFGDLTGPPKCSTKVLSNFQGQKDCDGPYREKCMY